MNISELLANMFLNMAERVKTKVEDNEIVEISFHYLSDYDVPKLLQPFVCGRCPGNESNDQIIKIKGRKIFVYGSYVEIFKTPDGNFWWTSMPTPLSVSKGMSNLSFMPLEEKMIERLSRLND